MNCFKKILIFVFAFNLFLPVFAIDESNEVFIYVNKIWTKPEIILSEQKTRIYTEFKNDGEKDLELIIGFYDNGKLIGERTTWIISKGSNVSWYDYEFNHGSHKIETKINKQLEDNLGGKKEVEPSNVVNLKEININLDTDGDTIPDSKDIDDDNDGYTDIDEIKEGSDSKSKISTPQTKKINKTITIFAKKTISTADNSYDYFEEKRSLVSEKLEDLIEKENFADDKKEVDEFNNLLITKNINNSIPKKNIEINSKLDSKKFNLYLYLLNILYFIFKYSFLTILFLLFISWISWKLTSFLFKFKFNKYRKI